MAVPRRRDIVAEVLPIAVARRAVLRVAHRVREVVIAEALHIRDQVRAEALVRRLQVEAVVVTREADSV